MHIEQQMRKALGTSFHIVVLSEYMTDFTLSVSPSKEMGNLDPLLYLLQHFRPITTGLFSLCSFIVITYQGWKLKFLSTRPLGE